MKPIRFSSETTPWRVIVPARYSSNRKRAVRYFRSLKDAERFCSRVFQEGSAALKDIKQTRYISNDLTIDALRTWLRPIAQADGYVIPYKMRRLKERRAALLKMLAIRLPENGLRNSFASYFMTARSEAGAGELAREMGNSETIAKSFYIRALEPRTGKEWFSCRP